MIKIIDKIFLTLALVFLPVFMLVATVTTSQAATTWNVGDVFVGVNSGIYQVYTNAGVLKDTVSDGLSGFTTGCALDSAGNLYGTFFGGNDVKKFDAAPPHTSSSFGSGYATPESIVFDAAGNVYVGNVSLGGILKFDSAGTPMGTVSGTAGVRVDWFDIAADQDTILYTQEGTDIKRTSISSGALTDFTTGTATKAFALRILSDGGVLLADDGNVKRYDSTGVLIGSYDVTGEDTWFSLNLDPDGTSFWAGNYGTGKFYKFAIGVPANYLDTQLLTVDTGVGSNNLFGLCLKGELTAAIGEIKLDPPTATNEAGTSHTVTATVASGVNPVPGVLVSFSVAAGGPNAGQVSDPNTGECTANNDCTTDAAGQVSWTYTNNGTPGTDVIVACFTDDNGVEHCARAAKEWIEPPSLPGRMTGGGTIPVGKTTLGGKHGFELHCDPADLPNRLEVNWGKGNKFHLESLTSALCSNDPSLDEEQPVAGFDTYKGAGTGRLNGVSGATAKWVFTDDGEPGTADYAKISISDGVNPPYVFSGNLTNGNQQAHPE